MLRPDACDLIVPLPSPSACPRGTDAISRPPMPGRLFFEEQVMTARSFCPIGQRGRLMGIIREKDRLSVQVRLDSRQFPGFMVVSVKTVVKEHIYVPQLGKQVNGIPDTALDDARPRFPDEISGFRIDVDRREATMPVSK